MGKVYQFRTMEISAELLKENNYTYCLPTDTVFFDW